MSPWAFPRRPGNTHDMPGGVGIHRVGDRVDEQALQVDLGLFDNFLAGGLDDRSVVPTVREAGQRLQHVGPKLEWDR